MYRLTQTDQNIRFDACVASIRLMVATLSTFSAANPAGLRPMTDVIAPYGKHSLCENDARWRFRETSYQTVCPSGTETVLQNGSPLPRPRIDTRALPPTQCTGAIETGKSTYRISRDIDPCVCIDTFEALLMFHGEDILCLF